MNNILTKRKFSWGFLLLGVMILSVSIPLSSQAASRVQPTEAPIVIVIDPGHGGDNEGTIENGFQEKSMTLITAQAMYEELCLYDNVEVYMTRTEDVKLTLKARAEYAAAVNADFLFSIHYNASVKHDLFGSEVWISTVPPFNAYGYQFGYQQMHTMKDMGLYLRGVKTKLGENQTDYYGIIRESTALSIPSVIIEHCHVDEVRDYPFCDTEDELIAFGKADALSVAKYFGLKSTSLGVDYSEENNLPAVDRDHAVQSTLQDETPPDVCMIELADTDESNGNIVLNVTAADYDSPLIYYDYSYDGGITYSPLQMWPGSDVLEGSYTDTFSVTVQIPSGIRPDIILRAYNMFDAFTESNRITVLQTFLYGEDAIIEETEESLQQPENVEEEKKLPGTTTFMPVVNEHLESNEISFFIFLKICLIMVIIVFILLLTSRAIVYHKRRKRRHQRRKEDGKSRNHPK